MNKTESDIAMKKIKFSNDSASVETNNGASGDAQDKQCVKVPLESFKSFEFGKVLNETPDKKLMFLQGKFAGSEDDAVVILEKTPFKADTIASILTKDTNLLSTLHNDIYSTYEGFPPADLNGIKTTLIYPATQKHIEKYTAHDVYIVEESAQDYQNITQPLIKSEAFIANWVYNILEKKKEADRIIYEDPDPEVGFILLPDFKWNRETLSDLHLMAIVHRRDIKSIRDLNQSHLSLLRNLLEKCRTSIEEKYGLKSSQVRMFFHYQPSYYHLHLHISHVSFDAPGISIGRGHLLQNVIYNISQKTDYYQTCPLLCTLSDTDQLYQRFKQAGKF